MKNKLIVFEGIDGVGKTTISTKLKDDLNDLGIPAIRYEDIEDKTEGYNKIKSFVSANTPIDSSLFFYIASSIYKSRQIKDLLEHNWVICDRYVYSTIAYHEARGAKIELVPDIMRLPIVFPDFYFMLCVKDDIRLKRLDSKKDAEPIDFQVNTENSFFSVVENRLRSYNPNVLDNSKDGIEEIVDFIKKSVLRRCFSKFSRGKDTTRLHVGGTGLGLYVGKNIVEAHSGKVWAESDGDGLGSRFIVEIPAV